MDVIEQNEIALEQLNRGEFLQTQMLLQNNRTMCPCCLSWNNLGWYYVEYGIQTKKGRHYSAEHIGIRYLEKAAAVSTDAINQGNLGYVYLDKGNYEQAYTYFLSAYTLSPRTDTLYNICVTLFLWQRYDKAAETISVLELKTEFFHLFHREADMLPLLKAFSLLFSGKRKESANAIRGYAPTIDTIYDFLALCSLSGVKEASFDEWTQLMEWYPTAELCAIVADCLVRRLIIPPGQEVMRAIGEWASCENISMKELIANKQLREQELAHYRFMPVPIKHCGFFGCKIHGNQYPRTGNGLREPD